ncbi:MAG: hypothetical protein JSS28_11375 [Proteobacteria bacterium]|nr:hypothetical protein [Pseudomonadota bacterium]
MKRRFGVLLAVLALSALGGCVYTPGYYARTGVVYDDGTAGYAPVAGYGYGYGYYAPGYYADPWCCNGGWWPWVGLNFYGGYYYGGHWRGRHGGWHDSGPRNVPRPLPGGNAIPRGSHPGSH